MSVSECVSVCVCVCGGGGGERVCACVCASHTSTGGVVAKVAIALEEDVRGDDARQLDIKGIEDGPQAVWVHLCCGLLRGQGRLFFATLFGVIRFSCEGPFTVFSTASTTASTGG